MATPSGFDRLFIAPDATAGTPADAVPDPAWIDLGELFGADGTTPTAQSRQTTMNRPKYANSVADGSFELADVSTYDDLLALEVADDPVTMAIRKADGRFRILTNQRVTVRPSGARGSGQVQTLQVRHYGAKADARDLLSANTVAA